MMESHYKASVIVTLGFFGLVVVLIGMLVVVADRLAPNGSTPLPVAASDLLPDARKRDPWACGQGLRAVAPVKRQHPELTRMFYEACCAPEVEDAAGLVKVGCERIGESR